MSRIIRSRVTLAVLSAAVLVSAACSSPPGGDEVRKIIGAAGGTLVHPKGVSLVIPAGALQGDVELSIKTLAALADAEVGGAVAGDAFVLGPDGQQFLAPVALTLPYDAAKLPAGALASELKIRISPQSPLSFEELETQVDEAKQLLSATTTHFSIVVPAVSSGTGCTALANGAPVTAETRIADAAPAAVGGTVSSGTYFRTSTVIYTGAGGATGLTGRSRQQTLKLTMATATTGTVENVDDNRAGQVTRDSGNLTLSGTTFTLSRTCPSAAAQTISYSATADGFSVIETVSEGTRVTTFTLSTNVDAGTPGTCSTLPQLGPVVSETRIAEPPPSPVGGAVTSGTYVRTADYIYTGVSGATGLTGKQRRHTLKLDITSATTGTSEEHYQNLSGGTTDLRAYSVSIGTTSFDFNITCPATVGTATRSFSYANDELRLFEPATGGTLVSVYSKVLADGGIPGAGDASTVNDGGSPDAGPVIETLGTGLTDLVDLDVSGTDVYVLGGGSVKRCAFGGCGTTAATVVSAYASSLAISGSTLFVTDSFRYVSSCDVSGGSCTLAQVTDVGANSYPTHLWIANSRVYWLSESGATRRVQVCPLTGCSTGYPKIVYSGSLLDGVALGGLAVNAQHAFVLSYTGGIYRIPLTDPDTGDAASASLLTGTDFGSGGLDLDAALLRFTVIGANKLVACAAPDCTGLGTVKSGFVSPAAVRSNATHVYGIDRGTPNGSGGYVANTATIWRYAR